MKILELHIRNIASIEKADIDFENDPCLQDPDTGKAAQKFLIFGDTGTGKSVLLDCISMSLFGKTPRLDEIKNKNNNSFFNANNNEVRIGSLEQYTRLGISANDECYSEVVFEGNDGIIYRARIELGMSESKGKLSYSKRKWTLQEGNEAEKKVDSNGKMITDVIGMSYDQFNRMAMLAQGQFANFLCGDRKERAEILEKLTDTGKFSTYGKAIHDIYSRKEKECATAKEVMDTAEKFVLSDDEVESLKGVLVTEGNKAKQASDKKTLLNTRISHIDKILENQRNVDTAAEHLAELGKEMESDSFKALKTLCGDWDATEEERKRMSDLIASRKALDNAYEQEKSLKERFAVLVADLAVRQRECDDEEQRLSKVDGWLAERQNRDKLYTESRLVLESLSRYEEDCRTLEGKKKEHSDAVGQTALLDRELQDAENEKTNAYGKVTSAQDEINLLLEKRNVLNPKQMDDDTKRLAKLKTAYETLRDDHRKWRESVAEHDRQTSRLEELSKSMDLKQREKEEAQKAYNAAAADNEKAMHLFSTVNASLDDKLDELRKRIVADNVEICPLCGQKIADTILTKEQFAALVTPFEDKQQRTKTVAKNALDHLTKVNGEVSSIDGQITTLREQLSKQSESIKAVAGKLSERMMKAGIDENSDIEASFDQKLSQIADEETELQHKRDRLAELQEVIDGRQKAKNILDDNLNIATAKLTAADAKVKGNNQLIDRLSKETTALEAALTTAVEKLDLSLKPFFPQWRDDVKGTSARLADEARQYLDCKSRAVDDHAALDRRQTLLKQASQIKDRISVASDWTSGLQPAPDIIVPDPIKAWNDLSGNSIAVRNRIDSCRQMIDECSIVLAEWRQRSGKDDDYLLALMAKRDEVADARSKISEIEGSSNSWKKIFDEAKNGVLEARKALSLADDEAVPDRNELQKLFSEQDEIEKESTRLCIIAKTKLEKNDEDQETMRKARKDYEVSKKGKDHWSILDSRFGGEKFRNLVQTQILVPLLNNANHYLSHINDRYTLTCTAENEQLSILVLDRYNRNEVRSATILSGGEKFMISLALSLALSSLNRPDMNVNILFIDEGFGTLDQECLNSVMTTLGKLGEMSGQSSRRVGIISHREELLGCIPNKIKLKKIGEGRSKVEIVYEP